MQWITKAVLKKHKQFSKNITASVARTKQTWKKMSKELVDQQSKTTVDMDYNNESNESKEEIEDIVQDDKQHKRTTSKQFPRKDYKRSTPLHGSGTRFEKQYSRNINTVQSRYVCDDSDYYDKIKKSGNKVRIKSRYGTDEDFRQRLRRAASKRMKSRYVHDADFRQTVKEASKKRRYERCILDANYRKKVSEADKKWKCEHYTRDSNYRAKVINRITTRYTGDSSYREKVIKTIKTKYVTDNKFRSKLINTIKTKYARSIAFRKKMVKTVLKWKKKKYESDSVYRQALIKANSTRTKRKYWSDNKYRSACQISSKKRKMTFFLKEQNNITAAINKFRCEIYEGPEFVCICCHRSLYRLSVTEYKPSSFKKMNQTLLEEIYQAKPSDVNNSKYFVCTTCKYHLKQGKIPPQAAINGLILDKIPKEINVLTELESILISQRIMFMKILALPRGKQHSINGAMVNVPANVMSTINTLPHPLSEVGLIPLKLKRKLEFKGHAWHQFIRPNLVRKALKILIEINPLYANIAMNETWENSQEVDEQELWKSLSGIESKHSTDHNSDVELSSDDDDMDNAFLEEKVAGIKYTTCLQPTEPQLASANEFFSVAPGEGQIPLDAMMDKNSELLAFPTKFPMGRGSFTDNRRIKLSLKKYANQRVLNIDKRFSRDINYLFYSQFITEQKQIRDNISIAVRKVSGDIKAKDVLSGEGIKNYILKDQAYQFLKSVRGTPPFWQLKVRELIAIVKQKGSPHFFLTLSSADLSWPELLIILSKQKGIVLTEEEIDKMTYEEKCKLLREDPVLAARQFEYRLRKFFSTVLLASCGPLGVIDTYFYRIEFQMRGSPHAHCLIWLKDGPNVESTSVDKLAKFYGKYISVSIPERDQLLNHLVPRLQKHSHSVACKKKKTDSCRFKFPRPPSYENIIAYPQQGASGDKETNAKKLDKKMKILNKVMDFLLNNEIPYELTLETLLIKLGVRMADYENALAVGIKGKSYIVKRRLNEIFINNYNPTILKAWQANMDIQPVLDTYACLVYICSYVTKDERTMSELLRAAKKDFANESIKKQLKKVGTIFLTHREVSAQEAAYRLLSLPMTKCNIKRIFVPTDLPHERTRLIKPRHFLEALDPESEEIYLNGIPERYAARPDNLENLCLADFAVEYDVLYTKSDIVDDVLPPEEVKPCRQKRITLKNKMGKMIQRSKRAVIRYHKFSQEKEPEKYYHSLLMLFYPWRNDTIDLLSSNTSFSESYISKKSVVLKNKKRFEYFSDDIEETVSDILESGLFTQSAWDSLAAEVQHDHALSILEGSVLNENYEFLDPQASETEILQTNSGGDETQNTVPRTITHQSVDTKVLTEMITSLNNEQRIVFQYILNWCCKSITQKVNPFYLFCTGGAGVGKSHLINTVLQMTNRVLRKPGDDPSDVFVHLTAPTGTAAYNIGGQTLHSSFQLPLGQSNIRASLSSEKLNSLRVTFSKLKILIIDEISMVGATMLANIHERLQAITSLPAQIPFGGISILAVGDLQQLPPVCDPPVFGCAKDPYYALADLWNSNFKVFELKEIMRQKSDEIFAHLLSRVRLGNMTDDDILLLKSRETTNSFESNDMRLYLYSTNKHVDSHNIKVLNNLSGPLRIFESIDKLPENCTGLKIPTDSRHTGGLLSELCLKVNCRVMLIRNVLVEHGLVNGAQGLVTGFLESDNLRRPKAILVLFDDIDLQTWAKTEYTGFNGSVIIETFEARFPISPKKGTKVVEASRLQFPLRVSFATTIHKCQGQTLNNLVVNMSGRFGPGQAYVAFSRCRTLAGLEITEFDEQNIRVNNKAIQAQNNMQLLHTTSNQNSSRHNFVNITYVNCRSWNCHKRDIVEDPLFIASDIAVFTETWLPSNAKVCIENRTCIVCNVDNQFHGGIMIIFSSVFKHSIIFSSASEKLQMIAIILECEQYIHLPKVILAAVYRSPNLNFSEFSNSLSNLIILMQNANTYQYPILLLGDFNVNLLDPTHDSLPISYNQFVKNATCSTGSLIDHVYWNGDVNHITCEVHGCYWSDHFIIETVIGKKIVTHESPEAQSSEKQNDQLQHNANSMYQKSSLGHTQSNQECLSHPVISKSNYIASQHIDTTCSTSVAQSSDTSSTQLSIPLSSLNYRTISQRLDAVMNNDRMFYSFPLAIDRFLNEFGLVKLPVRPDGHCLLYAWEIATGINYNTVKERIWSEYHSNHLYQLSDISASELDKYLHLNEYDLPSVDAVVEILSNAFNVTVYIIDISNDYTTDVWKFSPASLNTGTSEADYVFLLKSSAHYDALICSNRSL